MALSLPGEDEHTAGWPHRACALLWEWGEALYPQEGLECFFFFFLQVYSQKLVSDGSATRCGVLEVISCERLPFEMQSRTRGLGVGVCPVQTVIYVEPERS